MEKRRGRPPLFEAGSERLDLRLPADEYDRLCRLARVRGVDVRPLARRLLISAISAVEKKEQPHTP
jgi:hypothetical protein